MFDGTILLNRLSLCFALVVCGVVDNDDDDDEDDFDDCLIIRELLAISWIFFKCYDTKKNDIKKNNFTLNFTYKIQPKVMRTKNKKNTLSVKK